MLNNYICVCMLHHRYTSGAYCADLSKLKPRTQLHVLYLTTVSPSLLVQYSCISDGEYCPCMSHDVVKQVKPASETRYSYIVSYLML